MSRTNSPALLAEKQSKRLPRVLQEVALGGKPKTLALMVEHRAILSIRLLSDWVPVCDLRLRCKLP